MCRPFVLLCLVPLFALASPLLRFSPVLFLLGLFLSAVLRLSFAFFLPSLPPPRVAPTATAVAAALRVRGRLRGWVRARVSERERM